MIPKSILYRGSADLFEQTFIIAFSQRASHSPRTAVRSIPPSHGRIFSCRFSAPLWIFLWHFFLFHPWKLSTCGYSVFCPISSGFYRLIPKNEEKLTTFEKFLLCRDKNQEVLKCFPWLSPIFWAARAKNPRPADCFSPLPFHLAAVFRLFFSCSHYTTCSD